MIKSALFVTVLTGFLSFGSYGQVYERVYANSSADIQAKMNQNKMSGIDILSGIQSHHILGFSGIPVSKKPDFENLLSSDPNVISFVFNDEFNSLIVDSKGWFTEEKIREMLSQMSGTTTGYTVSYTLVD